MQHTTAYLETGSQDPFFNLAFEEYVLANCTQGSYLLLWQNENTVVIGRNQNAFKECRVSLLEEEEARRVQSLLHLSEAEVMEITHFERGNGLISTNNNNVTVEVKCSQFEKELITTDRKELQELLDRAEAQRAPETS